ncbi:MAG: SRPBCC family protein [Burkholderiales bacterium]
MTTIVSATDITGSAEAVFDLVTSARFWPQWHPATQTVSGVTDRAYRLGDVVCERARFVDSEFDVTWRVVEHERPTRVVLQATTAPVRIRYAFRSGDGAVAFRRELEYDEKLLALVLPATVDLQALMQAQSDEGVRRLKALVEGLLGTERAALTARGEQ